MRGTRMVKFDRVVRMRGTRVMFVIRVVRMRGTRMVKVDRVVRCGELEIMRGTRCGQLGIYPSPSSPLLFFLRRNLQIGQKLVYKLKI